MQLLIFGNLHRSSSTQQMQQLFDAFALSGLTISIDQPFYHHLEHELGINTHTENTFSEHDFQGDFAVSMGGDGTLLDTAARIAHKSIPIMGINLGRLGFLADINNNEIIQIIDDLKEHRFNIENRTVLYTETSDNSGQGLPYALNEVAILKQDLSSMIRINTTVNGEYLHTYEADGLIIATPTGSTAYALSVGGPIMVPEAENFIIAPVATHSLSVRPLIIPDQWSVELSIDSRSQSYLISLDGRSQLMPTTTKITIKKADYNVKIVRFHQHSFFSTLKQKLMWGADARK